MNVEQFVSQIYQDQFRLSNLDEVEREEMIKKIRQRTAIPTEFIISLRKKKDIHAFLKRQVYNDRSNIASLLTLLTLLNSMMLHDDEIERLYSFLCTKTNSLEVATTSTISYYPSPETLPHPYVEQIKQRTLKLGVVLGDYSSHSIYVIRMMGVIIGFVFTKHVDGKERSVLSQFDTESIESVFRSRYPQIQL